MSDILCVTNRRLCRENFLTRMEKIAAARPKAIILREKDLSFPEYLSLAKEALSICRQYQVPCILHSFPDAAIRLHVPAIHLPLSVFLHMTKREKSCFDMIGVSCHSLTDAQKAERLGCTYITAGHIFATDCKRNLPGRGIHFLTKICKETSVPVYAIGGITKDNIASVRKANAAGACIMSGLMQCEDVSGYLKNFEKAGENNAVSERALTFIRSDRSITE